MLSNEAWFTKKPCKSCPYLSAVTPFLHPARGEELAYITENPYSAFYCHKTLGHDDEDDDLIVTTDSLICAGFMSMQVNLGTIDCPDGFTPSDEVYSEPFEMTQAYDEEWEKSRG